MCEYLRATPRSENAFDNSRVIPVVPVLLTGISETSMELMALIVNHIVIKVSYNY